MNNKLYRLPCFYIIQTKSWLGYITSSVFPSKDYLLCTLLAHTQSLRLHRIKLKHLNKDININYSPLHNMWKPLYCSDLWRCFTLMHTSVEVRQGLIVYLLYHVIFCSVFDQYSTPAHLVFLSYYLQPINVPLEGRYADMLMVSIYYTRPALPHIHWQYLGHSVITNVSAPVRGLHFKEGQSGSDKRFESLLIRSGCHWQVWHKV